MGPVVEKKQDKGKRLFSKPYRKVKIYLLFLSDMIQKFIKAL
nr:MAG TPA: hypothetical protein [Caudoviricetes sp.]